MIRRGLQLFFAGSAILSLGAAKTAAQPLDAGQIYRLSFIDVDHQELSTADGHVTIIAVMTRPDADKARQVGDHVPDQYKGDPRFRLVTLINFQKKISGIFRGITEALIRHRLDQEAPRIQKIYAAKKLTRNARRDLFVIADFDGAAVSKLGLDPGSSAFVVFIFDREGRLIRRWNEVPSADKLAAALASAG